MAFSRFTYNCVVIDQSLYQIDDFVDNISDSTGYVCFSSNITVGCIWRSDVESVSKKFEVLGKSYRTCWVAIAGVMLADPVSVRTVTAL